MWWIALRSLSLTILRMYLRQLTFKGAQLGKRNPFEIFKHINSTYMYMNVERDFVIIIYIVMPHIENSGV